MKRVHFVSFLLYLYAAWLYAGDPQPFGIHLRAPGIAQTAAPERTLDMQRRLERTRAQIEALELNRGPYTEALAERLVDAAREAEEYGDLDNAIELLRWAVHNSRVNFGLNTERQLPLINQLVELLQRIGDRQGLREMLDYRYRLAGLGAEPYSEAGLDASVAWLEARIGLLGVGSWQGIDGEVVELWRHVEDLQSNVCADDSGFPDYCKPVSLHAVALLYLIDYHIDPLVVDERGNTPLSPAARTYRREWEMMPGEQRLQSLERLADSRARRILEQALERSPNDPELTLALADWYWFVGKRGAALAHYRSLLPAQAQRFSQAEPLPAVPAPRLPMGLVQDWEAVAVTVRVSTSGNGSDAVVTTIEGTDAGLAPFAARQLRALKFRPALDADGEPVESELTTTLWAVKR